MSALLDDVTKILSTAGRSFGLCVEEGREVVNLGRIHDVYRCESWVYSLQILVEADSSALSMLALTDFCVVEADREEACVRLNDCLRRGCKVYMNPSDGRLLVQVFMYADTGASLAEMLQDSYFELLEGIRKIDELTCPNVINTLRTSIEPVSPGVRAVWC